MGMPPASLLAWAVGTPVSGRAERLSQWEGNQLAKAARLESEPLVSGLASCAAAAMALSSSAFSASCSSEAVSCRCMRL